MPNDYELVFIVGIGAIGAFMVDFKISGLGYNFSMRIPIKILLDVCSVEARYIQSGIIVGAAEGESQ